MFRRLQSHYSLLFRPGSGSCIVVIFSGFGPVQRVHFYCFWPFWACSEGCFLFSFWPFWPFSGSCIFIIFGRSGHAQAAAVSFFSAVLADIVPLHFYHFWPFWPCSGGCIFITSGRFGHVQAAALFYFRPFWPCSVVCVFIISGRFGHVQAAALFLSGHFDHVPTAGFLCFPAVLAMFRRLCYFFLAILAAFRRLHFYVFPPFWPCSGSCIFITSGPFGHLKTAALFYFRPFWLCSVGCIFIISGCFGLFQAAAFFFSGRFGHVQGAAFLLFPAVFGYVATAAFLLLLAALTTFRRLHFYYFWLFWPCSVGRVFFFLSFCRYSGGCIFILSGRFGHAQAAAFLLYLADLAMFRRLHLYFFWPFLPCSDGSHFYYVQAA